jgi:4-hydroxy-tetrahydrodipicolinate synthase
MKTFEGTYTVLITPFDELQCFDEARMRSFVDWQIEQGIQGLVPLGSTGEFLSMSDEERHKVAQTVIEQAAGRVPVLVGTGAESTEDVIRYSQDAEKLGADGLLIIPPFYCNPTEDELFEHFRRVGDAVSIPIMIYNNPNAANVDMSPKTVARLSTIDNVLYIKESTLEITRVRDIIRLCGDSITVFGGVLGFESFLAGAKGWIAVGSNVMPAEFAQIYTATEIEKDLDKARKIYQRILPVIDFVFGHRYVSGTKTLLAEMGLSVGAPRSPRLPSPPEDVKWAKDIVNTLGLKS